MKNKRNGSYIVKPLNEAVALSCDSCGGVCSARNNYYELDTDQMYQVMLDNGPDCFVECKDANTGVSKNPVRECGATYGELLSNFTKHQTNGFKKNSKTFEEAVDNIGYEVPERSFWTEDDLTNFGGEVTEHSDYSFLEPDYGVGEFDMDTVATEDLINSGDTSFEDDYLEDDTYTEEDAFIRESLVKVMKKFNIKENKRVKALKMFKARCLKGRPLGEAAAKLWDEDDLLEKVNSVEFGKAILQICADQGVSKAALPAAFEMLIDLLGDKPDVDEVLNNWPSDSEEGAEEAIETTEEEAAEEESSESEEGAEPVEESVQDFPKSLTEMRRALRKRIAENKLKAKSKKF